MRRATSLGVFAMCAALTVACGNNRTAENNNNTGANAPAAATFKDNAKNRPAPVDVQGCLTASGDRFVLTSLQGASGAPAQTASAGPNARNGATGTAAPDRGTAPEPTTETYQLIATADNDLKKYVGQQVRVTGEADAARVAEVRELSPAVPAQPANGSQQGSVGTTGNGANTTAHTAGANEPQVRTEETTHFEVRKLHVSSVTPSGGACPVAPAQTR